MIDMGKQVDVDLLVTRGCACLAEESKDGSSWGRMGSTTSDDVIEPRGLRTRYLRVGGQGEDFSELREISVW